MAQLSLKQFAENELNEVKQQIYEEFFAPNIKPSPLKSIDESQQEAYKQIDTLITSTQQGIAKAEELFHQKATNEEKEEIETMMKSSLNSFIKYVNQPVNQDSPFSKKDIQLLIKITTRELNQKNYNDASAMFRFIIMLNPLFSAPWIGWALSESAQNHLEAAETIYDMASLYHSDNLNLLIYFAQFLKAVGKKEKANELLANIDATLKKQTPQLATELKQKLKDLK